MLKYLGNTVNVKFLKVFGISWMTLLKYEDDDDSYPQESKQQE